MQATPKLLPDPVWSGETKPHEIPIVIDFGSHKTTAGFADSPNPFLNFRTLVGRGKIGTGPLRTLVGSDLDQISVNAATPFMSDVPFHFGHVESVLDHVFGHLGCQGSNIAHPVLLTEPICCPSYTRQMTCQLMFECYGVPQLSFGVDALFSYLWNHRSSPVLPNGLILRSGYETSHILPIIDGQCSFNNALRLDIGGRQSSDFLHKINTLKYPQQKFSSVFSNQLKEDCCYVATDYSQELKHWKSYLRSEIEPGQELMVKPEILSFSTVAAKLQGDDQEKKEKMRQERSDRMKQLAQDKKEQKIQDFTAEKQYVSNILDMSETDPEQFEILLAESGATIQELKARLTKADNYLNKAMGIEPEKKKQDFSLIGVEDEKLSADEKKQKKKQVLAKALADAREEKQKETEARKAKQELEEKKILEKIQADPQAWYKSIMDQKKEIEATLQKQRQLSASRLQGRQTVRSLARMRALTQVEGEGEFGDNQKDWDKYLTLGGKDSEEARSKEEIRLEKLNSLLAKYWPPQNWSDPNARQFSNERENDQIEFTTCLSRAPEILFQPSMIGVDQMGMIEALELVTSRLPREVSQELIKYVFLTGGNTKYRGIQERLQRELMEMSPRDTIINVHRAQDPILDAWHGAGLFAMSPQFNHSSITLQQYQEYGFDYLFEKRYHFASNIV